MEKHVEILNQLRSEPQPPPRTVRLANSPSYLLLTTATTIFIAEVLVMVLLKNMTFRNPLQEAFMDGLCLSLLVFPALYLLAFRPLTGQIARQRRTEEEKNALIAELHTALEEVKLLQGIVPICASCKKMRDDTGYWQQVEVYLSARSEATFSHGICPECARQLYPDLDLIRRGGGAAPGSPQDTA